MVVQATPTTVDAGDPITLNIGIQGTGPMDLVQAPPLYELSSLTADFKVTDEPLAGFVQEDTKVFSTTIRPRREGISEIPSIRFSYFDPETRSYETAQSEPIAITVNQSESLAMDAIVGKSRPSRGAGDVASAAVASLQPNFTNSGATSVLVSQSPRSQHPWWWMFVVTPPLVWIATWFGRHRKSISGRMPTFRSAQSRCLRSIERASDSATISDALTQYISRRSGVPCQTSSSAMGVLRARGMYGIANRIESHLQRLESESLGHDDSPSLRVYQQQAVDLTNELEDAFTSTNRTRVRLAKPKTPKVLHAAASRRVTGMLLAAAIAFSAGTGMAAESAELSSTQQQTLLTEADATYSQAIGMAKTDSADAKELFETAADKYQLLVDSGIQNSGLYSNLGNAYLQSGELGRAIASYERALRLTPGNRQLIANLEFANSKVEGQVSTPPVVASNALQSLIQRLRTANHLIVQHIGVGTVIWMLAIASLVFWGLLIARTAGRRFHLWRYAAAPLIILLGSLGSTVLSETEAATSLNAVFVADSSLLYAGDGEQFDELASISAAQGRRVEVLGGRGIWTQVRMDNGQVGWVNSRDIQRFDLS